jgi:hypothetical protein
MTSLVLFFGKPGVTAAAEAGWPARVWMGEELPGSIRGGREQVGVDLFAFAWAANTLEG